MCSTWRANAFIDDTDWEGPRKNQLVIIGRDLDHDTLKQQLQACVVEGN